MAYDSQSDRIVVVAEDETFELDPASNHWARLVPIQHPGAGGLVAYDSESDRIVLYGGASGRETWAFDADTSAWTNLTVAATPGVHRSGSMAYDIQSDRVILFGGGVALFTNDTWSYDLNSNRWTNMSSPSGPSARIAAGMAYDAQSDRVVMYGGATYTGMSRETWSYNLEGNAWTLMKAGPSARSGHAMTYDSQRDRTMMFGGYGNSPVDELWAYDLDSDAWTPMSPSSTPGPRRESSMAYAASADALIMFGGTRGPDFDDTWSYDPAVNAWTPVSWGSPYYQLHGLAYDEQSGRIILVAGFGCADGTWAYDSKTDAWTNMKPNSPYGAFAPRKAVAYVASIDRVICFDGRSWAYDFDANTWTDMNANLPGNRGWSGQGGYAMAYDAGSDRVILFGGASTDFTIPLGDTWAYHSALWTNATPATSPPARSFLAMAYDAESDRVILFGGRGPEYRPLGDTWAYDFNTKTWTDMNPASAPSARSDQAAAYDRRSDRVVMFGGTTANGWPANDTWAYDYNTNTWANLTSSSGPSWRRFGHSMAYDSGSNRTIMFGGAAPNGVHHLTWALDFRTTPDTHPGDVGTGYPIYIFVGILTAVAIGALAILWRRRRNSKAPRNRR